MGFLGNKVIKLLLRNNTVSVSVSSLDHILEDSIIGEFSQIFCNLSQILKSNESYIKERVPVLPVSNVMNTL